jgi:hypothetical protein
MRDIVMGIWEAPPEALFGIVGMILLILASPILLGVVFLGTAYTFIGVLGLLIKIGGCAYYLIKVLVQLARKCWKFWRPK